MVGSRKVVVPQTQLEPPQQVPLAETDGLNSLHEASAAASPWLVGLD